jgi:hypothetical protein
VKSFRYIVFLAGLALAACSSERSPSLSLAPLPFAMEIPAGVAARLSTGPIDGPFADQVREAGALASTTVYYTPLEQGDKVILLTAYWFRAEKFDALQSPDQPPLFGSEVLRNDGKVLSVAGPIDAIFAPDTPDGQNLTSLCSVLYLPETYREETR